MWYSLVLYFCRIALRCFGMLLTPACIRKTVSGPYPKKDSLSSNLQHHPTFESCVNLFIWAFTWHVKHQVIQKSAQNLSFPTSPKTHLQLPNFFTSPGSRSLSFTSLAQAVPLMQSSRKGSTNWSGAMPVVRLATWSRERWKMATQQWWKYETNMKITTKW